MRKILPAFFLFAAGVLTAAHNLEVYCIDVEGGKATLWVSPSGESMLVDTGWPGQNHRDANRIVAAAKAAGVKKIDWLVITHYHVDHVGGVPQLAEAIPIRHFVDHGPSSESGRQATTLFGEYQRVLEKEGHDHIVVKAGDVLPIKGITVKIVAADGKVIDSALPGAGKPNPACEGYHAPASDPTQPENPHSIGMLITYGKLKFLDMGDVTMDREAELVCPNNKVGPVDFFMVSHHGFGASDSGPFVQALHPQVALMNNGPRKGGDADVWQRIHDVPGIEDIWQLHFGIAAGQAHNSPDSFIANVDEKCEGMWLKVTAKPDGSYTVYNSRNKFEKTYKKR